MDRLHIQRCSIAEANRYVAQHHRHNRPCPGAVFSLAAAMNGIRYGVALAGRPVARMLDDGATCEALRICVAPDGPKGTCSFLYGAVRRAAAALGFKMVITYTLATESGASLRGAGWRAVAELPARSGWDCAARPRQPGTVDGQQKIRWEAAT